MYKVKFEKKIEFTNDEELLIPSFKRETNAIEKEYGFFIDNYKHKIEQLERQNYILIHLLPRVMQRFYVEAEYSGYLPKITD